PSSLFLFRPLLSPRSTLFPYTTLFRSWTPVPALSHALRRAAAVHGLPTLSRGRRRRQPHRRVRPERARRHHRGRLRAVRPRPLALPSPAARALGGPGVARRGRDPARSPGATRPAPRAAAALREGR